MIVTVPDISVVIPCYNESENAGPIAAAVVAELERVGVSFEILFIDNASRDNTVEVIRALCNRDPRIRLIANTRNFGQMRSPVHAVFQTNGRAVIGMCADFQDPPELLGTFIDRWQHGVPVVLGVRQSEQASAWLTWTRELFYSLARAMSEHPIIRNATGFGLYDRKVVDAIKAVNEPEPFFRGLLIETGYKIETIAYPRPLRRSGKSSNTFFTLLDFALSGIASSPKKLVRLPFLVATVSAGIAVICLLVALLRLVQGQAFAGWLVAVGIELQFALMFAFLGVMGDQIRLVAARTRGAPLVIEQERINFPLET